MITIQQETDPNNKNTKNDDDDDDCVIVDDPLYKFKELRTHKEITDGLKAKLIVDDQEVSHHFYCLDNDYVNPKQAVNDYNQYSIHQNYFPGGTYSVYSAGKVSEQRKNIGAKKKIRCKNYELLGCDYALTLEQNRSGKWSWSNVKCCDHVYGCLKDKKTTIEHLAAGDGVLPIEYEADAREMATNGIPISKIHNIFIVMVNIDIIEKHSVIDVSDSTIFRTKFKRTFNHKVLHLIEKFRYFALSNTFV
jgi:hypothetical protein